MKIELHHIIPSNAGGPDDLTNCLPLCFDCHAEVGHYSSDHPKGKKFSAAELIGHRDAWHRQVKTLNDRDTNTGEKTFVQNVVGHRNIVAAGNVNVAHKFTTRVEVTTDPGGRHITSSEALQIKEAVRKYSDLMKSAGLSANPSGVWGRLYQHFQITSYKEIPFGRTDEALTIIRTETAKIRPKLRRRNPDVWRNQYYTAIYATANGLSMSKAEVYAFAYENLTLKQPISSLKKLTQRQLQELDRKIKYRAKQ